MGDLFVIFPLYDRHPPLCSEYPTISSKVNIQQPRAAFTTGIMFVCHKGVLSAAAAATIGTLSISCEFFSPPGASQHLPGLMNQTAPGSPTPGSWIAAVATALYSEC